MGSYDNACREIRLYPKRRRRRQLELRPWPQSRSEARHPVFDRQDPRDRPDPHHIFGHGRGEGRPRRPAAAAAAVAAAPHSRPTSAVRADGTAGFDIKIEFIGSSWTQALHDVFVSRRRPADGADHRRPSERQRAQQGQGDDGRRHHDHRRARPDRRALRHSRPSRADLGPHQRLAAGDRVRCSSISST